MQTDSKHVHQSIYSGVQRCSMADCCSVPQTNNDTLSHAHIHTKQSALSHVCTCAESITLKIDEWIPTRHTQLICCQSHGHASAVITVSADPHLCTSLWRFHKLEWSPAPQRLEAGRQARTWPCCCFSPSSQLFFSAQFFPLTFWILVRQPVLLSGSCLSFMWSLHSFQLHSTVQHHPSLLPSPPTVWLRNTNINGRPLLLKIHVMEQRALAHSSPGGRASAQDCLETLQLD